MARFDRMARSYDKVNPYEHGQELREALRPAPGQTVLDVGGGTGQVGDALRGHCRRYVVVDPSPGMLEQTRRKRPWIHALHGSGERLPLQDASVDRVVMVDALHHVPDQAACVREIARVLRPDGRAVVEEFRMERWWQRLVLVGMERIAFFGSRFRRAEGWRRLFEDNGLRLETIRPVTWSDVQFVLVRGERGPVTPSRPVRLR